MDYKLNLIAEFKDKKLDQAFFLEDVNKSFKLIRFILPFYSFVNLLFFIYDYLFLQNGNIHSHTINFNFSLLSPEHTILVNYSLIPRILLFLVAILICFSLNKVKSRRIGMNLVSSYGVLIYIIHMFMTTNLQQLDLTAEAYTPVLVIVSIALIPNRWITNLIYSVIVSILFFVLLPIAFPDLTIAIYVNLVLNLFWVISIMCILLYRINKYKRMQYAKEYELEKIANTDPLTKSYNRLACNNKMAQLCETETAFSIILLDFDDFKRVNDTYGHVVGDEVLVEVAETVLHNLESNEILARWGGEEFIVLLMHTSLEIANERAEILRQLIPSIRYDHYPYSVSASFGVTEYMKGDTLYSIIDRVDSLLYSAKDNGKNVVCSDRGDRSAHAAR